MENKIVSFLRESNKTISFAESCTGGALSKKIVLIPGASEFFKDLLFHILIILK